MNKNRVKLNKVLSCGKCLKSIKGLQALSKHLSEKHDMSLSGHQIEAVYHGNRPTCKCGCGQFTNWSSGKGEFYQYFKHHNSKLFKMSEEHKNILRKVHASITKEEYIRRSKLGAKTKKEKGDIWNTQERADKIGASMRSLYKVGKRSPVGGFNTGYCKWHKYNGLKVQGTFELRMCYILDLLKQNDYILDWEYHCGNKDIKNDTFQWIDINGIYRTYFPDFKIITKQKSAIYAETKGWVKEQDYMKWEAVRKSGNKIIVLYEKNIKKIEHKLHTMGVT